MTEKGTIAEDSLIPWKVKEEKTILYRKKQSPNEEVAHQYSKAKFQILITKLKYCKNRNANGKKHKPKTIENRQSLNRRTRDIICRQIIIQFNKRSRPHMQNM